MLRATITKFKRAYALAGVPRVLRGDFQIPPCNFEKISAIFMKSKSTSSSGSKHEEDEKCKKCKQLIELAFGPEKSPHEEGFEKIEVAKIPELLAENITQTAHKVANSEITCGKNKRIAGTGVTMSKQIDNDNYMPNIIKETKIGDEGKVEVIKEPPLFQSIKRNKGIHADRSTHVLLSKKDSKKQRSGDVNMLEMLAKQTDDKIDKQVLEEIEKLGISQQLLKDITNNSFGNVDGSADKFKKDIQKPGKISEIDLETRVLEKDQTKMSGRKFINRRAMKHLALHMGAEDISKNITSSAKKSSEVKMKKGGSNNQLSDDKKNKIEHKAPLDCENPPEQKKEKVKLKTVLSSNTPPERKKEKVELKNVLTSNILTNDRHIRTDHEHPLDSRIRAQNETLPSSEKLPENKREKNNKLENDSYNIMTYDRFNRTSHEIPLDSGKPPETGNVSPNILTDDKHIKKTTVNMSYERETIPQIAREKVKLGNESIKLPKEPAITTDENDNNEPAVLVKECQDPGGFRITPNTPKAQTLTDQLITLNLKIQAAIASGQTSEVSELKEKEEILTKEAARQKITTEIEKLFKDDRMPRHLFAHLTVVSKGSSKKSGAENIAKPSASNKTAKITNDKRVPSHMFNDLTVLARSLPKDEKLKKVIQDFYEQEHDPELIKPDRMKYNSPNDDIVEEKDYSLELDPRVVIRENFRVREIPPTQPHPPQLPQTPNYYSNYFHNQGNTHEENVQPYNMPHQNPYMPEQQPYMPHQNPYMPHQNPYMPPQNPYNMHSQNQWGGHHTHFYDSTMASAVMPVDESSNSMSVNESVKEMPHIGVLTNQMHSSFSEQPQEIKTGVETQLKLDTNHDDIHLPNKISQQTREIKIAEDTQLKSDTPHDGISLPNDKREQSTEIKIDEETHLKLDTLHDGTYLPQNKSEQTHEVKTVGETQMKLDSSHDGISLPRDKREQPREIKIADKTQLKLDTPHDGISSPREKRKQRREKKIAEKTQLKLDTPQDNIPLPRNKTPHVATTLTASEDKLIKKISTANAYATSAHQIKTKMSSSIDKSSQEDSELNPNDLAVTPGGNIKDSFENNLPNKVITTKVPTDQNLRNVKTNFKRTQPSSTSHVRMPGLTPETARVKVESGSMETPVKIRSDWRKSVSYSQAKPDIKPRKHYGLQSKVRSNPWIDKGRVGMKLKTAISEVSPQVPKRPARSDYGPDIQNKKISLGISQNMTLSEMLKKVRQRARLEMVQQLVMTAPAPKVKPTQGSCKKPKPPCPPPQKTCPSSEPKKCPPPQCPPKPKPAPKPCKPACPDPCATPKCPPAPKKDPCAKCEKTDSGTDIFGLVVTLGPMGMSKIKTVNSLFMEEMSVCGTLPDNISLTKLEDPLMETVKDLKDDISVPDLFHKTLMFPKNYEPWTPIPSWPIPRKVEKKKLVCPKDGCKVRGPPPPGAPCDTIHHPCAGFPNDKKRT